MEFQREVEIGEIVDPSDVVIVNLNFSMDNFEKCFSKMEFTMGMDYLSWAIPRFNIPNIFTRKTGASSERAEIESYWDKKIFNRSAHSAPASILDEKFRNEFEKYLPDESSRFVDVRKADAFLDSGLEDEIRRLGKGTVMITGFYTEVDVFITAMQALMHDFFSVVISDATSTYSERVFFQSLDSISQVVEVIDTRDLEKIWGTE